MEPHFLELCIIALHGPCFKGVDIAILGLPLNDLKKKIARLDLWRLAQDNLCGNVRQRERI